MAVSKPLTTSMSISVTPVTTLLSIPTTFHPKGWSISIIMETQYLER